MRYEATNGHILFRAWAVANTEEAPIGTGLDIIIPTKAIKQIVAFAKLQRKPKALIADAKDGRIRVTCGEDIVVDSALIDGRFPDTERVIPQLDGDRKIPSEVGFNLDYMATISKAIKLHTGNASPTATVMLNEAGSGPSLFRATDFLAVLMPLRVLP